MKCRQWLGLLLVGALFFTGGLYTYAETPHIRLKPTPTTHRSAPTTRAVVAQRPAKVRPTLVRPAQVPPQAALKKAAPPRVAAPQKRRGAVRFRHRRYKRKQRPGAALRRGAETCKAFLRRTGAPLCVELVSIGQGNWIFTYFGHNALRVVRRHSWRTRVYNFGTFSMAKPMKLLWDYLQFKVQYQLSASPFRFTRRHYRRSDRTLQSQRLRLTPAETSKLVQHLRWHYRPENRKYKYHHYTSNCSTKVRDALHKVLGPDFRKYARKQHGTTYRGHVMKSMRGNPFVMTMMDFGMGPPADRPLDWWADMFLPHHLQAYLAAPVWTKLRGRPLVTKAVTYHQRRQKPPRAWSPVVIVWSFALVWLLFGLLLFNRPGLRWYLRIILPVFAVLGGALLFMFIGTNFPEPPGNANILWFHPFHLVIWWMLSRRRWSRYSPGTREKVRWYFLAHAGLACAYLLLKPFSILPYQANSHYVFFALFVFGLGAARLWQDDVWVTAPATEALTVSVDLGAEDKEAEAEDEDEDEDEDYGGEPEGLPA